MSTPSQEPVIQIDELRHYAAIVENPLLRRASEIMLADPRWLTTPGSSSKHHVWAGGLVTHTLQVMEGAVAHVDVAARHEAMLDRDVVITAAIFHDTGKLDEYLPLAEGGWGYTPNHFMLRHILRSRDYFRDCCVRATQSLTGIATYFRDDPREPVVFPAPSFETPFPDPTEHVNHCILTHHGEPEWGSIGVPLTREAHCVHLADMNSVWAIVRRVVKKKA